MLYRQAGGEDVALASPENDLVIRVEIDQVT